MTISRREKTLLLLLYYLLLTGGLYKLIYLPVTCELAETRKEHHRLQKEAENCKQTEEKQDRAIVAWQTARAEYHALEKRIPQEPGLVDFIAFLEGIAVKSHVSLTMLSYNSGERNEEPFPRVYSILPQASQQKSYSHSAEQVNKKGEDMKPAQLILFIETAGSYYSLLDFLEEIGQSPRIITVDSCSLSAMEKKPGKCIDKQNEEAGKPETEAQMSPLPVPLDSRILEEEKQDEIDAKIAELPVAKIADSYDTSNFQMQLKIRTYYAADSPGTWDPISGPEEQ